MKRGVYPGDELRSSMAEMFPRGELAIWNEMQYNNGRASAFVYKKIKKELKNADKETR